MNARLRAVALANLQRLIGEAVAVLQQHQRCAGQIGRAGDIRPRHPVGGSRQQKAILEKRHLGETRFARGHRHHRRIQRPGAQIGQQLIRLRLAHLHAKRDILRPQRGQHAGQKIGRYGRD